MPTYEYVCRDGHEFEKIQKMSDKPVAKCPTCGAKAERRISGGQGFVFKGTGFYITDYGKDGKGAKKPGDGESASSGESKPEPKTEAKPAAKTDTSETLKPSKKKKKDVA